MSSRDACTMPPQLSHKKPPRTCQLCGEFQPWSVIKTIPFVEWVPAIRNSECLYCRVIVKAFDEMHPKLLPGACDNGPEPDEKVCLTTRGRGRMDLHIHTIGRPTSMLFSVQVQIFYSINETPSAPPSLSRIPVLGEVSPMAGDDHMWSFIKRCLDNCLEQHETCRLHQRQGWVPKRLLYLDPQEDGTEHLRLVKTKELASDVRYLALSHCWGKNPPFRTLHSNFNQNLSNISIADVPRTFQDCLTVARKVDVPYVWIDSLCIIQDDKADWAEHAATMDKVYENALFTVSAVSSESGLVPFLGPEAPSKRDKWQAVNIDQHDMINIKVRNTGYDLYSDNIFGPLEFRAWTYQERHLSTRIVFFTEDEVHWHCKSSKTCECAGSFLKSDASDYTYGTPTKQMDARRLWRWTVDEYSNRSLTYGTDRLPALSGVASRASASMQSAYLAGIWESDIHRQLAWHSGSTGSYRGSLDNGVPSWSWASVPGRATFLWEDQDIVGYSNAALRYTAKLVGTNCVPEASNPFGEVKPGSYIKLRSKVVEAELESDTSSKIGAVITKPGMRSQIAFPDCRVVGQQGATSKRWLRFHDSSDFHRRVTPSESLETDEIETTRTKAPVLCLLLFTAIEEFEGSNPEVEEYPCILILGRPKGKSKAYQRLGLASRDFPRQMSFVYDKNDNKELWEDWSKPGKWDEWKDWFAGAKTRTIKII